MQIEQVYEAQRDAITNPLDHVFELCSYSWTLPPGRAYKCKLYYRPFVPSSVNVDYFTIVDSAGERTEIKVRGTCIGMEYFAVFFFFFSINDFTLEVASRNFVNLNRAK